MAVYNVGKISIVSGSNQISGVGTRWLNYVKPGDTITLDTLYYVSEVNDNSLIILNTAYTGADLYKTEYEITISDKPEGFYLFDTPTLLWVLSEPAPIIDTLSITPVFKGITLSFGVLDAVWGDLNYLVEIWHNITNDFGTATLLTTQSALEFKHESLAVAPHYYWLRVVQPDYGIVGATTATGSQTPLAAQSTDIMPNAVSINAFATTFTPVVGAGGGSYVSVASFSALNDYSSNLPFTIDFGGLQTYSGPAVETKFIIRDATSDITIMDFGSFTDKVPLPQLTAVYVIPAGATRAIHIYWWGADGTVTLTNRTIKLLGLKR